MESYKINTLESRVGELPIFPCEGGSERMMEKSSTEDNRVCWLCKFCGKAGGDKSIIRRHVKSKHLKQLDRDKMSAQTSEQSEEYDVNDAIEVMLR